MVMPSTLPSSRRYTEDEFLAARDAAPRGERWELLDVAAYFAAVAPEADATWE